jgi:hypothetical protein
MGRKPTLPEKREPKKIYLDKANKKYLETKTNMTEYLNKLIEKDRLENIQTQSEGTTVYQVKSERLIKG